jgi:uncharacterized RDD family membrane protein YckC
MIYANLWKRTIAAFIDFLILSAIGTICIRSFFLIPVACIINLLYKPIFEASAARATPGKSIMGIAVVKINGDQLTLKDSYIRYLSSFISSFTLGLGYVIALFTEKNQTLHDFFAGTVVVEQTYENSGLWNEWVKTVKSIGN